MFRFRIWDNEEQEYLENLDSFSMDSDGYIRWYDGSYLNAEYICMGSIQRPVETGGRYEVEFGNAYCFHNDIVQGKKHGGHWSMERVGNRYCDAVPRNHVNMIAFKGGVGNGVHDLYWDVPIRGIALMMRETMEITIAGITCEDEFYGYEGERFSWSDISVVGNIRSDNPKFCEERLMWYEHYRDLSILPKGEDNENNEA